MSAGIWWTPSPPDHPRLRDERAALPVWPTGPCACGPSGTWATSSNAPEAVASFDHLGRQGRLGRPGLRVVCGDLTPSSAYYSTLLLSFLRHCENRRTYFGLLGSEYGTVRFQNGRDARMV